MSLWVPPDWEARGEMPLVEPDLLVDNKGQVHIDLDQDMLTISAPPDSRFIIDVGWYPDLDLEKGSYVCYLFTKDGLPEGENPWHHPPLEKFETRSTAEVWSWLSRTVSDVYRRYYHCQDR
jgi:hypothetical protein